MTPVHDPRFSSSRWEANLAKDVAATARAEKLEYVKPLVLLILGGGSMMYTLADQGTADISGAALVAAYPIVLAVELVIGIVGLWITCKLLIGGAGPFLLACLRLAGIYAATDALLQFTSGLMFLAWILNLAVYIGLLTWLFELDLSDSIILALITWVLKIAGWFAVFSLVL